MIRHLFAIALVLALLLPASRSVAQCNPDWIAGGSLPGLDGIVYASTVWDPDGTGPLPAVLVVGGTFSFAGSSAVSNIAWFDGSDWHPLGAGTDADVYALTVYNNELIAAGGFGTAGGVSTGCVAAWNGQTWHPLGSEVAGVGYALIVNGSDLVVGGQFFPVGLPTSGVLAWNGAQWTALGSVNAASDVRSLTLHKGVLIAGGRFASIGGANVHGVAAWNGAAWEPLGSGTTEAVVALQTYGDDLIAGGLFTTMGGIAANNIARWDGTSWHAMVGLGTVDSLAIYRGDLIAGGIDTLVRWDGSAWHSLSFPGVQVYTAFTLCPFGNDLIVGGTLSASTAGGGVQVLRWDGSRLNRVGPVAAIPNRAFASVSGQLYGAGEFGVASSSVPARVARWDGTAWQTLPSPPGFSTVAALANFQDQLVAGDSSFQGVMRWTGTTWVALGTGFTPTGIDAGIHALTTYKGALIAGGHFTAAGGGPANNIAAWDGSMWRALGQGLDGAVYALMVYQGDLIAAGSFTAAGGNPAARIARWDGSSWQALGSGLDQTVLALTVHAGGLIAGGHFSNSGELPVSHVARWDGSAWTSLGSGTDESVKSLTVHRGDLIAGGSFATAGGSDASYIARWTGTSWESLGPGLAALHNVFSNGVTALTTFGDDLLVGGYFGRAGDRLTAFWARYACPCYPNCDNSSAPPVLNINDFICFQQQFAAGNLYANCDGSTTPPVLNVNDLVCFQSRFASGCN